MTLESTYQLGEVVLGIQHPSDGLAHHGNHQPSTYCADFSAFPLVDWQVVGLLKPSFAKPVVTKLEQALVILRMGFFTESDFEPIPIVWVPQSGVEG